MTTLVHTPVEEIPKVRMNYLRPLYAVKGDKHGAQIRETLRATFKAGVTRPLAWRKHQLYQLARLAQNEADVICDALAKDLAKPRVEVLMGEVGAIVERATKSADQLDVWAAAEHPEVPDWQKGWKPT